MFSASVRSRVLVLETGKENIAKATWKRRELVRRRGEHELVFGVIEERRWCCKRYSNLLPMKWSKTANVKVSLGCCSSPQMLALDGTFLQPPRVSPPSCLPLKACRLSHWRASPAGIHSSQPGLTAVADWFPPAPPEGKGCWLISEQHLLQMFSGAPRPSEQRWMGRLVDPAPSRDVLQSSTSSRFWETAQACMHACTLPAAVTVCVRTGGVALFTVTRKILLLSGAAPSAAPQFRTGDSGRRACQ